MNRAALLLLALVVTSASTPAQTTLVAFSFEGTTAAHIGASRAMLTWNSGGTEGYLASNFFGQGQSLSIGGFQSGEYFQFALDTSGYGEITLGDFRTNGSAAAPRDWRISYSLTGLSGSFVEAATYTITNSTAANATTVTGFTLPGGADDNASLVLRLIASSATRVDGGGGAANGTVRLDNFVITGTAIPEPATFALVAGLAMLALAWHRRRAFAQQKGPPVGGPAFR